MQLKPTIPHQVAGQQINTCLSKLHIALFGKASKFCNTLERPTRLDDDPSSYTSIGQYTANNCIGPSRHVRHDLSRYLSLPLCELNLPALTYEMPS
jgi:hypothetical protein